MSTTKPQTTSSVKKKKEIPTFGGNGVRPGIDLNNSAALWELIESDRDSERREHFIVRTPKRRR